MPYDSEIAASNLSAAMQTPEVYVPIFEQAINQSAIMSMGKRLPDMSRKTTRMSVLDLLPISYWQATGTSLKNTTNIQWKGKTITAEEMAVIVPIEEALLEDTQNTGFDIWPAVTARVAEAMAKVLDASCFMGTNLPSTFLTTTAGVSQSLLAGATAASNTVALGTGLDLYDDVLGESGIASLVENHGFDVTGYVAGKGMKGKLRHVRADRTATGAGLPLFVRDGMNYNLDGVPVMFPKNGAIDTASALMFCGDWEQLVWSLRSDIKTKLLTEGVIQDGEGAIQYNLAQQDMVALRFTFRIGVQIANPVTQLSATEATRYPFAVLTPASGT